MTVTGQQCDRGITLIYHNIDTENYFFTTMFTLLIPGSLGLFDNFSPHQQLYLRNSDDKIHKSGNNFFFFIQYMGDHSISWSVQIVATKPRCQQQQKVISCLCCPCLCCGCLCCACFCCHRLCHCHRNHHYYRHHQTSCLHSLPFRIQGMAETEWTYKKTYIHFNFFLAQSTQRNVSEFWNFKQMVFN